MAEKKLNLNFNSSRYFTNWVINNKCNILVSAYNIGKIFMMSINKDQTNFLYYTTLSRVMGMSYNKNKLLVSSLGNLITYKNIGKINNANHGLFDKNFSPLNIIFKPDVDIHDICITDNGDVYYISSLFSCICKPNSENKTFDVYWQPPWITKIASEDRCHLNGLCCIDNKPKYVTSICMSDTISTWADQSRMNEGVVFDVQENKIYCKNLSHPHSPKWYNNKLWLLESGTGYLGYVENNVFVKKVFIPGFLRGLQFHNNFAIVNTSLDRHNKNFSEYELGKTLKEKNVKEKCGIWIINLDTFDIAHQLWFIGSVTELYDVCIIPDTIRSRVMDFNDGEIITKFVL